MREEREGDAAARISDSCSVFVFSQWTRRDGPISSLILPARAREYYSTRCSEQRWVVKLAESTRHRCLTPFFTSCHSPRLVPSYRE